MAFPPAAPRPDSVARTGMPQLAAETLALLPASDESPRCAVHAAGIGVDPGGTAISANAVALVEVPLPWPKPVFASGMLEGFMSMMDLMVGPTRVLAEVPEAGRSDSVRVTLHRRVGARTQTFRFEADGTAGLRGLFAHLARHLPTEPVTEHAGFALTDSGENECAVLICTQGSHDVCCGSEGSRLVADFEAVLQANSTADHDVRLDGRPTSSGRVTVHRVSHTGGHRFAPTAMTLPDGRMWADIEAGELASILDRTGDAAALAPRCRGWWGAATGPAQIAERAVFAHVGWPFAEMARELRLRPGSTGWEIQIDAADAGRWWTAKVTAGRTVPTIACRALGGLPSKAATEFIVTELRESRSG